MREEDNRLYYWIIYENSVPVSSIKLRNFVGIFSHYILYNNKGKGFYPGI